MNLEHMTDLLRPFPISLQRLGAARGVRATLVIRFARPSFSTTRGTQHTPDRLIGHAVIYERPVVLFPLSQHAGPRFPIARAGSSSEDQVQLEGGQAEPKASDGQGQRRKDHLGVIKWQRVPGRRGDRLCHPTVFQVGCVPGATDGSMPVGSVEQKCNLLSIVNCTF